MTNYDLIVCRFNYDMSNCESDKEYHEQLIYRNGDKCLANIHDAIFWPDTRTGYWMVDCIFEDDTELTVYLHELTVL